MIPITIEEFADMTVENNKDLNRNDLIESLKATLESDDSEDYEVEEVSIFKNSK